MHRLWLLCLIFLFPNGGWADYQKGKDYGEYKVVLPVPARVIEFFSYGCPACSDLDPTLTKWLSHKPKAISFKRVPVVFHPNWLALAKAYYTAEILGIEAKLTPVIFTAIHQQSRDLNSEAALAEIFAQHGIKSQTFSEIYEFAPRMQAKIAAGERLLHQFAVYQVPTLVIDGHYWVNPSLTQGNKDKLFQIVDYLLQKINH